MNLEALRSRAQQFTEEVSREGYMAYSGLKSEAALQEIYARYPDLMSEECFEACVSRFREAAPGSEDARAARMMLEWHVDARVGRQLAPMDEREVALENASVIRVADGREIPYQRAAIEIANSSDAAEREALDVARAAVAGRMFSPLNRDRLSLERDAVAELGLADGYNATFELLSGISLSRLGGECEAFLRDTSGMWSSVLGEHLAAAGLRRGEATRADSLAMFRMSEFDDAFPASSMEAVIRRNCAEMGLDPTAGGNIIFDLGDRAGKRPRAFCSPVRVPEEVYLVLRPLGGQSDYGTFLHELGHALHFANTRADFPFEYRLLGDNSVTEGYAMLFDHRTERREWLQRYTGLERERAGKFLRYSGFEELHFVRRYCAKLLYEIQVYDGSVSWESLPSLYTETLADATGFRYRPEDAFLDLDPRFYSTRYLRAWQLQALLDEGLVERFNEDWWRNPAAGPWLVGELFAEGQRESASELAQRVSGADISFEPITRRIEALLTA